MKKVLIMALVVLLAAGMAACAPQAAAEKQAEQIIEGMTDGNVDVDISDGGETISINTEDGEMTISGDGDTAVVTTEDGEVTFEGDEDAAMVTDEEGNVLYESDESGIAWPAGDLTAGMPVFEGVVVTDNMPGDNGATIMFEGCDAAKAGAYLDTLKAAGWEMSADVDMDGEHMVSGTLGGSETITFMWTEETGEGMIMNGVQ